MFSSVRQDPGNHPELHPLFLTYYSGTREITATHSEEIVQNAGHCRVTWFL